LSLNQSDATKRRLITTQSAMETNHSKDSAAVENTEEANLKAMNLALEQIVQERTQSLLKMNKNLELANRELDAFIYRASHDFRAPIASINGLIHVAKMEVKDETALGFLEEIKKVVGKTDNMLRKLLMVNMINRYGYSVETVLEPAVEEKPHALIDFEAILAELRAKFQPQLEAHQIELEVEVESDLNYFSDGELIQIILNNMLENSIIYRTKKAGVVPFIRILVHNVKQENCVKIIFSDNGTGIPNKYFRKIFRMFFRGNEAATEGNGLGLYVVKKAVQKLRGRISVESEVGRYTTFHVFLPREPK